MRCAKTPDGKPIAIGHKPPVIKPSEARVHASVGENAVVNLDNLQNFEGIEESVTMSLSPSDVVIDDIPSSELDLNIDLDALVNPADPAGPGSPPQTTTAPTRPEAPTPVSRPEAPTLKPGSSPGLRPNPTTAIHTPVTPDTCPSCKGKVRVGAVLCVQCGTTLNIKPATEAPTPTATQGTGSGFFTKMIKAVVKPKDSTLPGTQTK